MRIWYDACTGKHVRYGAAIAKHLRKLGHEVVFTTREHPDTLAVAKLLGEKPVVVGKYNPASLLARVEESAERILQFSKLFKDKVPDFAISSPSIELCRFAFGINIPSILTADTPHADAANRLTLPLATTVVASEAIPKKLFEAYGAQKIVQFKGVDEVAWIKDSKPSTTCDYGRPLIVVRQIETKAAYACGKDDNTIKLAEKLSHLGNLLFLPRYSKPESKKIKVADNFVDSASLAGQADLVVSAGGTISREAALQGTPSIVISDFGQIEVNKYLHTKGFPIFTVNASQVEAYAKRYLGKRFEVKKKLEELENPLNVISKLISAGS
jgi:predicted glycosyltransferase